MNVAAIWALIQKDVRLYFANRLFALVTALGLVAYVTIYFLLPATVDETVRIGMVIPSLPPALADALADDAVQISQFASADELRAAVAAGTVTIGFAFPPDLYDQIRQGARPAVELFLAPEVTPDLVSVYEAAGRELSFSLIGQELPVTISEVVLGPDLAGAQIAPRQRMLPLFAVLVLMVECLGLASLIVAEVEQGTIRALLVTPLTMRGLFLAKSLFGSLFAFVQAVVLMAVTGGLAQAAFLNLTALLIGSVLMTGVAFLIAALGRDLMSVMGWGMLALLIMALPTFTVLIPGLAADWVRLIPTHYLVDTIYRSLNFGAGWSEVGGNLAPLAGSALLLLAMGMVILQRRFA
ncbi:ABC transporter permease [Chloroflexus sp.]|uniref:ABC transporter permease n=1 Tax=Chloroflexus sp. TaxID=1904827 RepID=UPI00260BE65E|nr:ABC transporter permease [uncultured Chloroflexus sp.]